MSTKYGVLTLALLTACGGLVTDPPPSSHDGTCTDCRDAGPCPSGGCQPIQLTSGQVDPSEIVVDATTIYWIENGEGTIRSMPKGGGAVSTLLVRDFPRALAVDGSTLYYAWESGSTTQIFSMPKGGGASKPLVDVRAEALALDDANVYWAGRFDGRIGKVPKTGGPATILATRQASPISIVVAAGRVCWVNAGTQGAKDGSVVCDGTTLASGLAAPAGLAFDGTALYFSTGGGDAVVRMELGGTTRVLASGYASRPVTPFGKTVAVDVDYIHWIAVGDSESGTPPPLLRAPKQGGAVETIDHFAGGFRAVATDGLAVYWSGPNNAVWRRAN